MPETWTQERGLLGFPEFTHPTFTLLPDTEVYATLRQDDCPAFIVARPGAFFPDYEVDVPDTVAEALGIAEPGDADDWVVITQSGSGFSANPRGPIVLNVHTGAAAQCVLGEAAPTHAALDA